MNSMFSSFLTVGLALSSPFFTSPPKGIEPVTHCQKECALGIGLNGNHNLVRQEVNYDMNAINLRRGNPSRHQDGTEGCECVAHITPMQFNGEHFDCIRWFQYDTLYVWTRVKDVRSGQCDALQ
jgi:hypothetical protein